VARHIAITRSGGTPASAHFETPCGETGGEKIAPIAEYEPMARQTLSKAETAGVASMAASVNRQLMLVNPRLLHAEPWPVQHQPMVEQRETMADRLKELKGNMSLEKFGALAGVSSTSAMKWLKGGDVKDSTLRKLIAHEPYKGRGITVEWIRYGDSAMESRATAAAGLSMMAIDIASRWMALSEERQDWFRDLIFTMHFMEVRFPAMRKGRPKGEHYRGFETAVEKEMRQMKLKLD
jgi:transcriptional regulator with XRE-family HTH domain